jgi:uncharacterized protein YbjT (DUF2867 family)
MIRQVLVIGGTGRTGRHLVNKLRERQVAVRVMSRQARGNAPDEWRDVTFFDGSIVNQPAIMEAAAGVDAIVVAVEPSFNPFNRNNSAEKIFVAGQGNVNAAAAASGNAHVVLVSQIYITRPQKMPFYARAIGYRDQGEQLLRESGLPYTIVRAGWLGNEPGGRQTIRFEQGDTGEGNISREDVAEVCVQALFHLAARHKTFEVYNQPGPLLEDWPVAFEALELDTLSAQDVAGERLREYE